jgi:DNA helicase HerA-like ATPase
MCIYLSTKERDGSAASIDSSIRKHCAIFCKSGVGKTTFMRNMIAADLAATA